MLVGKRLLELGKPVDWAYEMIFAGLAGGFIGARVYYMAQHWDDVRTTSSAACSPARDSSGTEARSVARRRSALGPLPGLPRSRPARSLRAALALGYAIGRIGCQLSGDGDYGSASDLPWAMAYPDGTVPTTEEVHPTPVYETLAMGLIAWVLWRLRDRFRPGMLFALYLVLSG